MLQLREEMRGFQAIARAAQSEAAELREVERDLQGQLARAKETWGKLTADLDGAHAALRDATERLDGQEAADARTRDSINMLQRQIESKETVTEQARLRAAEAAAKLVAVEGQKAAAEARESEARKVLAELRGEEAVARRREIFAQAQQGSDLLAGLGEMAEPFFPGAGAAGGIAATLAALVIGAVGGKKYLAKKPGGSANA